MGTAFGESILNDSPRHSTVVTREYCELLRVEQKDFKILWEVGNKQPRPILKLRSVTCHMRSHSVTCHPTLLNRPRLNPSQRSKPVLDLLTLEG